MILVVGATGTLGSEICRRLRTRGEPVKAMVRPGCAEAKMEPLQALGATLVEGDLRDRSCLDAACRGVTAVISTASAMPFSWGPENTIQAVDLEGQISLVDAARAAGVPRFVYVSISGNIAGDFPLSHAKRAVQRHLQRSGLTHTILRPSYFMEVWLSPALGFDPANARARLYGSGQGRVSWISLQDVAAFAVECLTNPAARNATIELGGPEALSQVEAVGIFEQAIGRPFATEFVSEAALRAQQAAAPDPLQASFAGLMLAYAAGDPIDMRATLQTFRLPLTSVSEYANQVVGPQAVAAPAQA